MSVVVSDTGPLHYLILCEAEDVLPRLFSQVVIPSTVFGELEHPHAPSAVREWTRALPSWVKVQSSAQLDSSLNLDRGETEAICLAREIKADAVLIDDLKGRNAAVRCGLVVTGTVGVLEAAATRGLIDLPATFARLQGTSARLDPEIMNAALARDRARRPRG